MRFKWAQATKWKVNEKKSNVKEVELELIVTAFSNNIVVVQL